MLVRFWAAFRVLTTSVAAQPQTGRVAGMIASISGLAAVFEVKAMVGERFSA